MWDWGRGKIGSFFLLASVWTEEGGKIGEAALLVRRGEDDFGLWTEKSMGLEVEGGIVSGDRMV